MGISVISTRAAAGAPPASTSTPSTADGAPGDFAALLSGQTLANAASSLLGSTANTKGKAEGSGQLIDITGGQSDEGQLPDTSILAAMIGIPPLQATVAQGQHAGPAISEERGTGTSDDILSALTKHSPQLPEELGAQRLEKALSGPAGKLSALDTEDQLAGLTKEAANIAAGTPNDTAPLANFNSALSAANLQHEITPKQTMVNTQLTSEAWPSQFSEKIVWLAKNDLQTAQININPPQLGPIQITLNLDGNQASAIFGSPHAEVRQAIEAAMPQLREMLSTAGISLGDANVGANLAQQNPETPFPSANKNQSRHENAILPANENTAGPGTSQVLHRGRGLVDLFA